MNLWSHTKNSSQNRINTSNQSSRERLRSWKDSDVSPFLKSYSAYTTPRKSDRRGSNEVPSVFQIQPEKPPSKDSFAFKKVHK